MLPFTRDLSRRLVLAASGAGLLSCGGPQAPEPPPQPPAQGTAATPPLAASAGVEPPKEPLATYWRAGDYFCMPRAHTDKRSVDKDTGCGTRPQASLDQVCEHCLFRLEPENTALEAATHGGDACCYAHQPALPRGRLTERAAGGALLASVRRRAGWRSANAADTQMLAADQRARLAAAWTEDARMEHGSIASFSRLALELLRLGAPAALVRAAHEAALDEVAHARDAFALASGYGGQGLGPGPLPLSEAMPIARDRRELVARSLASGCVGETLAAVEAGEAAEACMDPQLRAALLTVAADEARHAELAFAVVHWALGSSTRGERASLERLVFAELEHEPAWGAAPADGLPGRLRAASRPAVLGEAWRALIAPALRALVA